MPEVARKKIAVIGSGIAGMSSAWLLSSAHDVYVYEKDDRIGGHTNTVDVDGIGVDTGFIVYNERNYPNLVALFKHLGVETWGTDMSFGASMDHGAFEYAGSDIWGLIAQKRNLLRPRFWAMVRDIMRFYKDANALIQSNSIPNQTLGDYLTAHNYSHSFKYDHLLPMGAAIWSTPVDSMLAYPFEAFLRFCDNHGLIQLQDRPQWRTVVGGSQRYAERLIDLYKDRIRLNQAATKVYAQDNQVIVEDRHGNTELFDDVVLACHGDQSLKLLHDPDPALAKLLAAFKYQANKAILHTDVHLMPKRKKAWSSWNYLSTTGESGEQDVCVTYWMNKLQNLPTDQDYFVTLNPLDMPREGHIIRSFLYHHPLFDREAVAAQPMLWNLQGKRNIWLCGSYFGHGFHEDALQSGLAVAEALGGVKRPWQVDNPSGRINLPTDWPSFLKKDAA